MTHSCARTLIFTSKKEGIIKWKRLFLKERSQFNIFPFRDLHLMTPSFLLVKISVRAHEGIIKWNLPLNDRQLFLCKN